MEQIFVIPNEVRNLFKTLYYVQGDKQCVLIVHNHEK